MPPSIRAARPDELDRLAVLLRASWLHGIAPLVPGRVRRQVMAADSFTPFLRAQGEALLVAELRGVAVGVAAGERGDDQISDLWVAPEHQGLGVGSALLAALESRIAKAGYQTARLEVLSANVRALALYRYRGYRPVWQSLKLDRGLGIALHKTGMAKALPAATRP